MRTNPKRTRKTEVWESLTVALRGGLEEGAAGLLMDPGRFLMVSNWEEAFGVQGYTTIKGYERYSGKASPSACNYAVLPFDTGTSAIAAGDTVTNGVAASALVVSVTVSSGTWGGGNAAGYLILTSLLDEWADNDLIRVGGVTFALASDDIEIGSRGYSGHEAALRSAREALRALIAKPVGDGAILGVAVFNQEVYCVRNIVGDASATLWKSSASGWTSVRTGLAPSTNYEFEVANFSGATTTVALFAVNGRNRLFKLTTDGTFSFAGPIYGSEGVSTTNVTVGMGAKTWTASTGKDWVPGDRVTIHKPTDWSISMTGDVSAYNSGTGQLDVTVDDTSGAGAHTDWEIGLADYSDKPYLLRAHSDHMFLAYTLGQLQSSNLGDPMTYTGTSTLFGIGAEITALSSLKGTVLGIFGRQKIKLLSGTSSLDWDMDDHTRDSGATAGTVQDNSGNAIFLDDKGLTTLQGTLNFGDFEPAILSKNAKKTLDAKRTIVNGSRMAKYSNQYRLYFSDATVLRCSIMSGNPVLTPKDVSMSLSEYDHVAQRFASGVLADGLEHNFFGTSDGWVMEEDAGTSFDGEAIVYAMILPYNHFKTPNVEKNFHKMIAECLSLDPVTINFRQLWNYDDGTYRHGGTKTLDLQAVGGAFDIDAWDTFDFDRSRVYQVEAPLDGAGSNMALIVFFESDFVRPITLQALLIYFSRMGLNR